MNMRNVTLEKETFEMTDVKFLMLDANIGGGLGVGLEERKRIGSLSDVYRNIGRSWERVILSMLSYLPSHLDDAGDTPPDRAAEETCDDGEERSPDSLYTPGLREN